ncbi:Uncharacterized protein PBTT_01553 [Plasmodiophora brassicae]|uniref:Uncharacterized protein n=1 Tax=Plasmodiophora brassicae TaxID=37360 RepID=A0A0G4IIL7_PLABS|nr:hypothetical protein PBRA_003765 [Plasmodiophora brassicae]SPQ94283.1 unnamed protein product [Plasmodiophora brassicae]
MVSRTMTSSVSGFPASLYCSYSPACPIDHRPPPVPAFYEKTWACFTTLPGQQVLSVVQQALAGAHDVDIRIDNSKWRVWIHAPNLFMIVHVFVAESNWILVEFQRRTGDRTTFREFASSIVNAIRDADPELKFASSPSSLSSSSCVPTLDLDASHDGSSDSDALRKPVLDSPMLDGIEVSEALVKKLLSMAASPIYEVHAEALRCLLVISQSSTGVASLRSALVDIIPILCERLHTHDDAVSSMTALLGMNILAHASEFTHLSPAEEALLSHTLIAKIEEHNPCVESGVAELYDVVKTLCKRSPTICT